jgi:hypothetical protein
MHALLCLGADRRQGRSEARNGARHPPPARARQRLRRAQSRLGCCRTAARPAPVGRQTTCFSPHDARARIRDEGTERRERTDLRARARPKPWATRGTTHASAPPATMTCAPRHRGRCEPPARPCSGAIHLGFACPDRLRRRRHRRGARSARVAQRHGHPAEVAVLRHRCRRCRGQDMRHKVRRKRGGAAALVLLVARGRVSAFTVKGQGHLAPRRPPPTRCDRSIRSRYQSPPPCNCGPCRMLVASAHRAAPHRPPEGRTEQSRAVLRTDSHPRAVSVRVALAQLHDPPRMHVTLHGSLPVWARAAGHRGAPAPRRGLVRGGRGRRRPPGTRVSPRAVLRSCIARTAISLLQTAGAPLPSGVTSPRPVTTTRRPAPAAIAAWSGLTSSASRGYQPGTLHARMRM